MPWFATLIYYKTSYTTALANASVTSYKWLFLFCGTLKFILFGTFKYVIPSVRLLPIFTLFLMYLSINYGLGFCINMLFHILSSHSVQLTLLGGVYSSVNLTHGWLHVTPLTVIRTLNTCITPKNSLMLFLCHHTLSPLVTPGDPWAVSLSTILPFQGSPINGIVQSVTFWDWFLSVRIMPLKSIQIVAYVGSLSLLMDSTVCCGCLFIRSHTEGHLDCLRFLVIISGATNNIGVSVDIGFCVNIGFHCLGFSGVGWLGHIIGICLTL